MSNIDHHSQVDRTAAAGNIMAYIQSAQRALRFVGVSQSDETYRVYKEWMRHLDSHRQSARNGDSWEELSLRKKWLHWEEIIETVKMQKDAYELAPPGIRQAKESVKYTILLFYSCLPPGRAQEYRTLQFQWCEPGEIRTTAPTPADAASNVLYIARDGRRGALYIGLYKTSKNKGPQKIMLDAFDYFVHHLYVYLTKHLPLLLAQQTARDSPGTYVFVVRHQQLTHTHTAQSAFFLPPYAGH